MKVPRYEELVQAVLDRVPEDVDKREGSLLFTAVAPVCAELIQGYFRLAGELDQMFADTAEGAALDRLSEQAGIRRREAVPAVCRGVFRDTGGMPFSVPNGMRMGIDGIFYRVNGVLAQGECRLVCETAGEAGNRGSGRLLPADHLEGFGEAELAGILEFGQEPETDEELRRRLRERVRAPAFGGNAADYREKTRRIEGVGAVKVTPCAFGAGTVLLTLLDQGFGAADSLLVERVQQAADPEPSGEGKGFAPIGHRVTAEAAKVKTVDVSAVVTVQAGAPEKSAAAAAQSAVEEYFLELRKSWESSGKTVARISRIAMRLLECGGVLDVSGVKLNGAEANLELGEREIPVLGKLELQEVQQ